MQRDFRRVAIVNRGEAAMRFIHAAREFNHEHGPTLCTIALYTDADRRARFVHEADESYCLGPAQTIDAVTGQPKSSYVDYRILEQALLSSGAEAVWVGWGFVAEDPKFVDLCRRIGVVFIGPDSDSMRLLGDKITSKRIAEQEGVPVVRWSAGPVETLEDAIRFGEGFGYPLLIKATAGGGGHGIRRVHSAGELARAFESARSEAFKAFGDATVFIEQLISGARHVEVQIIADHYGNTWAVGVRDCTIQRRHQKILEEAPSPALSQEQDRELRQAAVRLSHRVGYANAGTVEFLYQPATKRSYFMEMNTRLQVEHPVTECTTGVDLVKLQIHVARGGVLEGEAPGTTGHAIEVRLYAEDPENGFAPAPGCIERFRIPTGPGVRIDTGVAEGDQVPAEFDPMIAKLIAFGRSRDEALCRLRRALRESAVVIRGGASNKAFLHELLGREEVRTGALDIGWLDRLAGDGAHISRNYADVAMVHAAIEAYNAELVVEQTQFYASAVRGRPQANRGVGRTVDLRYRGRCYSLKTHCVGPHRYRIETDGTKFEVGLERVDKLEYSLTSGGKRFQIVSVVQALNYQIEVNGIAHRIDRDDGGVIHAQAPAVVVSIAVNAGDRVAAGDTLAVVEAMKMEMRVVAPFSGIVRQVMIIPYLQVDAGAPLMQIEPSATQEVDASGEAVVIGASFQPDMEAQPRDSKCRENLEELRSLMLGFDIDPLRATQVLQKWSTECSAHPDDADLRAREDEILGIFVDICSLFNRHPEGDDVISGEAPTSEALLFSYLRMLDTHGDGLPATFVESLKRVLAHYGVRSLTRSAELEQSLLWIYKSHQRVDQQIASVIVLLERRLSQVEELGPQDRESFRSLLDRMIFTTRGRFPAVSDLAREIRYQSFGKLVFEQARNEIYEQVEEHLAALAAEPDSPDRTERVRALVSCPQPLATIFTRRFVSANPGMRQLMLEVLTLRYYRIRCLMGLRALDADGDCCISAEYDHEQKRIHVFTTAVMYHQISRASRAINALIQEIPPDHDVVIDFYAWRPSGLRDADETSREVQALLNGADFARPIRRIVVAVTGPGVDRGTGALQHFTYRPAQTGYEEEKVYRGLHPMMAKRLHLWRFQNFDIERLPSAEDVYLFRGVARENPKDERLFACAEVRDLTPVRDAAGNVIQLPHLERMLAEALAAIRLFQSRRKSSERLYWNRVLLYVWPPLTLTPDEFHAIMHKLAPDAEGLGLEQVVVRARIPNPATGELREMVVRISNPCGSGLITTYRPVTKQQPLRPLTEYDQKVVRMRQRGLIYPYEVIRMMTPAPEDSRSGFPPGDFVEYDLDPDDRLSPVNRPHGRNKANIIAGVIRNYTDRYPEGMPRVLLMGDPSKDLGAIAEPECRRIISALDLAEELGVPLEWFPISAGAKISMDSGVENMDWIARVLRRLVEFTQRGGEVNLVVNGINVGAQPYWNAEATMLMHTRGILIMTPQAAMVLTGKRALEYSGSVSAEDNQGIGGYDRIMGVNGQAQYWARDINDACHILLSHYEHTYVAPGERFPRRAMTTDPIDRDVRQYPHGQLQNDGFVRVGEIFSDETNPGRKKSFEIRRVMMAVVDQDHQPMERWPGMRSAETAVVWDAHLGGYPVCLIGIESHPVPRLGFVPADGPDQWTAGTLFPLSSKKVARAINSASNNRPVVVLANLSGFDGSPESMRKLQLEYGAEIGRAVVNFKGPMVFCVISRYHGGAYVVFSRALNDGLEVAALEGTYASVIGGAPAAAVVFAGEVESRTRKDARLQALNQELNQANGLDKGRLRTRWNELFKMVHSEKLGEVAEEFDRIHSVHRALEVGALHRILPPAGLRAYLVHAIEHGMAADEDADAGNGDVEPAIAAVEADGNGDL